MFNTILVRSWLRLSLIWTGILLLPAGQAWWVGVFNEKYQFYLIAWLVGILLYPVQLMWLQPPEKFKKWLLPSIVIQFLVGIGLAGIYHYYSSKNITTNSFVIEGGGWEGVKLDTTTLRFLPGDAFSVFYLYFIHATIGLFWVYTSIVRIKEREETTLKLKLADSQIKVLQSELQPHFIFNTLHTANSLMEDDVRKAQLLLEKFSFLLRHYLSIINQQFYTLQEEMDFLTEYIEVQQIRSSAPIKLTFHGSDGQQTVLVPVILLQPIIENSIKHGWHNRSQEFEINISFSISNGNCILRVTDSGFTHPKEIQEGVGLRNLRDRLSVVYGTRYWLAYRNEGNRFVTDLAIPTNVNH